LAPSQRPPSKATSRPVKLDLKPSRITLRLNNVKADEVLERFSKQAGGIVFELSNDLWPQDVPRIGGKVQIINQPFWPALREVLRVTGTRLGEPVRGPNAAAQDRVIPIAPQVPGGAGLGGIESGPVLIQVMSSSRASRIDMTAPDEVKRTVAILMQVLIEPKFDAIPLEPVVRVEAAEDDKGRAITYQPPQQFPPAALMANPNVPPPSRPRPFEPPGIYRAPVSLVLPAAEAQRIAKLKGVAQFTMLTGAVEIQVPDVLHVAGTDMRLPGGIHILIPEVVMRGGQELELRLVAWNDGADPANWEPLRRGFVQWAQRARLVSADGADLLRGARWGSMGSFADVVEVITRVRAPEGEAGKYRLIWSAPTSAKMLSAPFELTDLELPK
jgi:hypothetical protein